MAVFSHSAQVGIAAANGITEAELERRRALMGATSGRAGPTTSIAARAVARGEATSATGAPAPPPSASRAASEAAAAASVASQKQRKRAAAGSTVLSSAKGAGRPGPRPLLQPAALIGG